jgi:hypothetical protein
MGGTRRSDKLKRFLDSLQSILTVERVVRQATPHDGNGAIFIFVSVDESVRAEKVLSHGLNI